MNDVQAETEVVKAWTCPCHKLGWKDREDMVRHLTMVKTQVLKELTSLGVEEAR